jgi:hypothetical protein
MIRQSRIQRQCFSPKYTGDFYCDDCFCFHNGYAWITVFWGEKMLIIPIGSDIGQWLKSSFLQVKLRLFRISASNLFTIHATIHSTASELSAAPLLHGISGLPLKEKSLIITTQKLQHKTCWLLMPFFISILNQKR